MLARVANSLYWAGRYIERSEHLARYLKVQYFSTFDAPMIQQKEVILQSILYMASNVITNEETNSQQQHQQQQQSTHSFSEQDILVTVGFDLENSTSILSSVQYARENARNVRYTLSSELWEAINAFYHYTKEYPVEFYKTRGLYDFTTNVIQHSYVVRSYADSTLLHDNVWAFFKLGIYLERAVQILRILNSKVTDIHALTGNGKDDPLTAYQWTTTLKTLEGFDMHRKVYRGNIKQENEVSFLLTHSTFPRSVAFTLGKVNFILSRLTFALNPKSQLNFQSEKLETNFKFLEYKEVEEDLQAFLGASMEKIYNLNDLIEQEYFE